MESFRKVGAWSVLAFVLGSLVFTATLSLTATGYSQRDFDDGVDVLRRL